MNWQSCFRRTKPFTMRNEGGFQAYVGALRLLENVKLFLSCASHPFSMHLLLFAPSSKRCCGQLDDRFMTQRREILIGDYLSVHGCGSLLIALRSSQRELRLCDCICLMLQNSYSRKEVFLQPLECKERYTVDL